MLRNTTSFKRSFTCASCSVSSIVLPYSLDRPFGVHNEGPTLGACLIGRIGIQISDPSDPSESTERYILDLDCCHVDEVIKWSHRSPKRVKVALIAHVVRKVNKSISIHVCAYHNVYKNDVYPPYTNKGHIWIRLIWIPILPIEHTLG